MDNLQRFKKQNEKKNVTVPSVFLRNSVTLIWTRTEVPVLAKKEKKKSLSLKDSGLGNKKLSKGFFYFLVKFWIFKFQI